MAGVKEKSLSATANLDTISKMCLMAAGYELLIIKKKKHAIQKLPDNTKFMLWHKLHQQAKQRQRGQK